MSKAQYEDRLNSETFLKFFFRFLMKKKIITNSAIYISGNFLQKALAFIFIPILTHFLSPEEYGIYGLAISIEGILIIVFSLGIQSSMARYYYDYVGDRDRLRQYISSNFVFLFGVTILMSLLMHFFGESLWNGLTSGKVPYFPYIELVQLSACATILINYVTTLYQTEQKARSFVIARTLNVFFNLIFAIIFVVVFKFGTAGQLFGRMISTAVVSVFLVIIFFHNWFTNQFRFADIKTSLLFGFPLVFHSLFAWALASIDRLMLEPHITLSELGLYNLGYQIGGVMIALLVSINQAWVPYYYSIMKNNTEVAREKIKLITNIYVVTFGFICLLGMLLSKQILGFMSTPQYLSAAIYVPIILFAALFNGFYFMSSTPIFFEKKTFWIPIMTGLSALLNIGLNMIWIPKYGALGSAWATLISYIILSIIAHILGQHLQPIKLPLGWFGVLTCIIAVGMYISTYSTINGISMVIIKLALVFSYLFFVYLGFVKSGRITRSMFNYPTERA
jgi:O-antigen/teichoic acid export membrane protein